MQCLEGYIYLKTTLKKRSFAGMLRFHVASCAHFWYQRRRSLELNTYIQKKKRRVYIYMCVCDYIYIYMCVCGRKIYIYIHHEQLAAITFVQISWRHGNVRPNEQKGTYNTHTDLAGSLSS